jgi:hypothetical protein
MRAHDIAYACTLSRSPTLPVVWEATVHVGIQFRVRRVALVVDNEVNDERAKLSGDRSRTFKYAKIAILFEPLYPCGFVRSRQQPV